MPYKIRSELASLVEQLFIRVNQSLVNVIKCSHPLLIY